MNTKTCKNCGWVYPITQPGRKCQICGATFDIIVCTTCNTPTPLEKVESGTCTCKACAAAYDKLAKARKKQRLTDAFDQWMAKVALVPKNYPALTEAQWLEACSYFDGCARCDSKDIDSRGFFIGSELGGRYCDWNVIPLCERCASRWNLAKNVFTYVETCDHNAGGDEYRKHLAKILEYLGGKLDGATKTTGVPKERTDNV